MTTYKDDPGLGHLKVTGCTVIHKESEGSVVIKKDDGTTESILTNLPEVNKGHGGIILEINGASLFLREPYKG